MHHYCSFTSLTYILYQKLVLFNTVVTFRYEVLMFKIVVCKLALKSINVYSFEHQLRIKRGSVNIVIGISYLITSEQIN